MRNSKLYGILISLLVLTSACQKNDDNGGNTTNNDVATVEIVSNQSVFVVGSNAVTLEAVARNAQGQVLNGKVFTWTSSSPGVIAISANGEMTFLDAGTTTITATSEGVSGTLSLEVRLSEFQVDLTAPQTDFQYGTVLDFQIQATVTDANGAVVTNPDITWESLDTSVLEVDGTGEVTVKFIGQTEITATYEGTVGSITIEVQPPNGEGDFSFISDDTELRATINLPSGSGPFPAVVFIHGSGTAPRSTFQVFADILTNGGVAVFFYDKRGTGESGGTFVEVGPTSGGIDRVNQLGRDAIAALEFMRTHAQVRADDVGLMGFSQGGWVNPSAIAPQTNNSDFMVNVVGPVCTVGEEIYYSNLIAGGMSIPDANLEVYNYTGPHGYDPVPDLEQINIPSLWVLGGQDESIPTQVTMDRLDILVGNGSPFERHFYPNGNHFLIDVTTGQQISYLSGPGGVIDWILDTTAD